MWRRIWALSAAVLVACASAKDPIAERPTSSASAASDDRRAPTTTRREPAEDLLDDGVAERHPLRAWLVKNDPLVFAEGRPPIARSVVERMPHPVQAIVVDQVGDQLRVLLDGHDVRLLVLVPPACTALVVKRAAWLSGTAGAPPSEDEGVRLAPGVLLEETEVRGPAHRVRGEADGVPFEGWLDAAAVDQAFVAAPFVAGRADGLVVHGAAVTDATGQLITHLPLPFSGAPREFELRVETGSRASTGKTFITYKSKSVEVRGFVRDEDYKPLPPDAGISTHGTGWGDGGGMSGFTTKRLAPGTSLFDEEGARVGKVKNESTLYLIDRPVPGTPAEALVAGWIHSNGIGFVRVRARQEDLGQR